MDNGPEDYFGWATRNQWRDAYTNSRLQHQHSRCATEFCDGAGIGASLGQGKKWGGSGPALVRQTLENWQVSSSVRLASGLLLYGVFASYSNHLNNYGFPGSQLADWVPTPKTTGNPNAWIDPTAFSVPTSDIVVGATVHTVAGAARRAMSISRWPRIS